MNSPPVVEITDEVDELAGLAAASVPPIAAVHLEPLQGARRGEVVVNIPPRSVQSVFTDLFYTFETNRMHWYIIGCETIGHVRRRHDA